MGKSPAFQLYASDFDMDTAAWTCDQVGAYMRLLMYEWVNGGLPKENASLARIARIDPRNMQKMWSTVLAKKFTLDSANLYVNNRLETEREKQEIYKKSQAEKGKKRASERWAGHIAVATKRLQPDDKPKNASSVFSLQSSKKNINNRSVFVVPSFDEVSSYCTERGGKINPQTFMDYYTGIGWKVGANPMKDWKAVVRTWESKGGNGNGGNGGIRTNRSDPRDATLQSRTDAEVSAAIAKYEAAKNASSRSTRGATINNDETDF
jgi:uncharacterized protein YdaU (DUF1376 family)